MAAVWAEGSEGTEVPGLHATRRWDVLHERAPGAAELSRMDGIAEGLQGRGSHAGVLHSALASYEKMIERLVIQWPNAWGFICQAEDKARAERLEKIRRQFITDKKMGKSVPDDFKEDDPWPSVFRTWPRMRNSGQSKWFIRQWHGRRQAEEVSPWRRRR